jgi:hypothetical protein
MHGIFDDEIEAPNDLIPTSSLIRSNFGVTIFEHPPLFITSFSDHRRAYHPHFRQLMQSITCQKCRRICENGGDNVTLKDGSCFHRQCFTCDLCFSELPLKFALKNGRYYHTEVNIICYQ